MDTLLNTTQVYLLRTGENDVPDLGWHNVGIASLFILVNSKVFNMEKENNEIGNSKITHQFYSDYIIVSWTEVGEIATYKFNSLRCSIDGHGRVMMISQ